MYDPKDDITAMVTALRQPAQNGVQLAGDVIPLPVIPSAAAGPTNQSADYAWGKATDPQVGSIGTNVLMDWLARTAQKIRSGH